ncbi:MAG: hypothetical protein HYX47_20575 [Burkholderiales bacterium]|nr:hypothetical protein [Burkholderiales bacterium]
MRHPCSAARAFAAAALLSLPFFLSGCAVITVVDTAASLTARGLETAGGLAIKGAGLAAETTMNTMRLTNRLIGAAADAALPAPAK